MAYARNLLLNGAKMRRVFRSAREANADAVKLRQDLGPKATVWVTHVSDSAKAY